MAVLDMNEDLLKIMLPRLTRHSFGDFIVKFFRSTGDPSEPLTRHENCGENIYFQPLLDSYGKSLHSVFVVHYSPLDLLSRDGVCPLDDPLLVESIQAIHGEYNGQLGQFGMVSPYLKPAQKLQSLAFLTNLSGIPRDDYDTTVIPKYAALARKLRIPKERLFVGSCDSFLEKKPVDVLLALRQFIGEHSDTLRIALNPDDVRVERVISENHLSSGILPWSKAPLQPIYGVQTKDEACILEFELLLRKNINETQLETFLIHHYKLIFGETYDRIETQLWLKCPQADIGGKSRRSDIFLRNAVTNDWELIELKKSNVRLTSTERDVPILTREVTKALSQIRNYSRLLSQESVRRNLALDGIDYCEPTFNLVIGRTPTIPHRQWRFLVRNTSDVKITTYDNLLAEARMRMTERNRFFDIG